MNKSSRARAREWPYPRYNKFRKRVQQAAKDWFAGQGFALHSRYPYILDSYDNWTKNIILSEVSDYIIKQRETALAEGHNYPLHKYIHHGLSSQALVFNLIGPMMVIGDFTPLVNVLKRVGVDWPNGTVSAQFEYEDRAIFNEDSGQPTSMDVVIFDENKSPKLFIESKFVEQEFGSCSVFSKGDCDGHNPVGNLNSCYLHFIGRRYWELLEKHGFLEGEISQGSICILLNYYQFFREVLMALEMKGTFLLLCDERSPVFAIEGSFGKRGLFYFLLSLTPEHLHDKIKMITIQQVIAEMKNLGGYPWVATFEDKYGLSIAD